jgi:hypothetical protein
MLQVFGKMCRSIGLANPLCTYSLMIMTFLANQTAFTECGVGSVLQIATGIRFNLYCDLIKYYSFIVLKM